MGRACSTYGGEGRCVQDFGGETRKKEDLGLDGSMLLIRIIEKWDVDMDWIHLSPNKDRWWALVYTVMNLWVP
jgi:hypothetical protein